MWSHTLWSHTFITQFGWPTYQRLPNLDDEQYSKLVDFQLMNDADEISSNNLDPRIMIPTQEFIDVEIVQNLIDVEYVPPIVVILKLGVFFIFDGHHRATRALLDGQLVRAVIFNLEVKSESDQEQMG